MDGQNDATALKDATSNPTPESFVEARVPSSPAVFYQPYSGELWVVPIEHKAAFENECRLLDRLACDLQEAKEQYQQAQDELLKAERAGGAPGRGIPQDPQIRVRSRQHLLKAEQQLQIAQKAVDDEFKPLEKLDGTGGKLTELIPIQSRDKRKRRATTRAERDGHSWARNWSYVRNDKVKDKWRRYPLHKGEQAKYQSASGSFLKDGKIDRARLNQQLSELDGSAHWKGEVAAQGVFFKDINRDIADTLDDWAAGINGGEGQAIELKAEAQLLRYFAGAGALANWAPQKGNVALRADARAEFAIAEGKFSAAGYWPSRGGHMLRMTGPKSGTVYDAGQIRLGLQLQLFGLAGASACGQLGLEVDYTSLVRGGKKAGLRGRPSKKPLSSKGVNLGRKVRDGAEVSAAGDLFAGARAGGDIKGLIEWNDPESQQFTTLCKIGPGGQVQAGAGISGQFRIDYNNGKFRLLVAGSVCLGVGAGGKLEFEVDVKQTFGFSCYLAHTLYAVNYEVLEIVAPRAFEIWKVYSLWAVRNGKELIDAIDRFDTRLQEALSETIAQLEKEVDRVELMDRVLANPKALEYAPPETKGMILYQLTRHSEWTKTLFLPQNQGLTSPLIETLDRRKRSIMTVILKVRSKAEYRNIFQHMTVDGSKDARGWQANEAQVQEFLTIGADWKDLDEQMLDHERSLAAVYDRLYDRPVLGHPFMDNDQPRYLANALRGDHGGFRVAGGYDPGPELPAFDRSDWGNDEADTRYA